MSIEALWVLYIGEVGQPVPTPGGSASGVVVLESGRAFGGDGAFYWVGSYRVDNGKIAGELRSTHYNGDNYTIFGTHEHSYRVAFEGALDPLGNLVGHAWRPEAPNLKVAAMLVRKAELP